MFYVYEWFNKENGYVFYVGKGSKNRYISLFHRNKLFLQYITENKCESRIISFFDLEEDSFKFEHEKILELKSTGQCCCNIDNAGKSGCNFVWTDEMKKYKSVYNPMKTKEQKQRMSKFNPMKNPNTLEKVRAKTKRPVVINGIVYSGVKEASFNFNVCEPTIRKWCKKGYDYNGNPCRYQDEEQKEYVFERYNLSSSKAILYQGKKYINAKHLSKEIGFKPCTINKWAKKGFDTNGNSCIYINDLQKHTFIPKNKHPNSKQIEVNGKTYPSKKDAEIQLGLCKGALAPFIAGTRKEMKYVCRYVNQQPSHAKSDNSSMEGSTTRE